jgi:molecular chaperone GrpE
MSDSDRAAANPGGPDAEAKDAAGDAPEEEARVAPTEEPAAGSQGDGSADQVSRDLDKLLEDTKRERDEYLDLAQRARADFENYRKRAASEARDAERRGRTAIAKDLVPSLDNLERALLAAGIDPAAEDGTPSEPQSEEVSARDALAKGVELVLRELRGALARSGVEAFDPAGEAFDPAVHEAVASRPADGTRPGTVVETVDKGYRLDDQVLRAARVIVAE